MSSVNYSLRNKGVRLISSDKAWVIGKNGKAKLNPKYRFIGKLDLTMPNMLLSASDKTKPKFRCDVSDLNIVAKGQIVNHFYDSKGKRNKRTKAYLVIPR